MVRGSVLGVVMRLGIVDFDVDGVIAVRCVVVVRMVVRMVVRVIVRIPCQRRIAVRMLDAMREARQLCADEARRQPQRHCQRKQACAAARSKRGESVR